jgi:cyanate permease
VARVAHRLAQRGAGVDAERGDERLPQRVEAVPAGRGDLDRGPGRAVQERERLGRAGPRVEVRLVERHHDAPAGQPVGEIRRWLRDARFWTIGAGASLALSVSVASLFLVRHLEKLGIERTDAALVPSLMAAFGIVGKLSSGWLIDRVDARAVVTGALWVHALGWATVATHTTHAALLAAAAPLGLGGGGFLPLPAVLQGRCFGRDAMGRVSGLHALIGLPFLLATAPLVGLAEVRTGSFGGPFLGLAGALLVASAMLASVRPPRV